MGHPVCTPNHPVLAVYCSSVYGTGVKLDFIQGRMIYLTEALDK